MESLCIGFFIGVIFSMIVFAGGVLYGYSKSDNIGEQLYNDFCRGCPFLNDSNGNIKTARLDRQNQEKDKRG